MPVEGPLSSVGSTAARGSRVGDRLPCRMGDLGLDLASWARGRGDFPPPGCPTCDGRRLVAIKPGVAVACPLCAGDAEARRSAGARAAQGQSAPE